MSKISGKELTNQGKQIMEAAGWIRLACFNSHRPMPRGARGISDNIYIHPSGHLLFVEDKGTGDKLREEQIEFKVRIDTHPCKYIHYVVAETLEDYRRYSLIGKHDHKR